MATGDSYQAEERYKKMLEFEAAGDLARREAGDEAESARGKQDGKSSLATESGSPEGRISRKSG